MSLIGVKILCSDLLHLTALKSFMSGESTSSVGARNKCKRTCKELYDSKKNLFYSVVLKRTIPAERRIAFALGGYPVSLSNDKSFAAGRHPAVNKWGI